MHINLLKSNELNIPMNPEGYVLSVLTFPSTRTWRCINMEMTSRYVRAYLSLFRRIRIRGKHSLDLWGPDEGLGACTQGKDNVKLLDEQI